MTAIAIAARPASAWRGSLVALALASAAILLVFRHDVAAMAGIWWTSTTFGHCLFIPPVVAWLIWTRRAALADMTPQGWWPGIGLVAVGGLSWMVGEAAAVALARQIGLVVMLQGAVLTILGPHIARALLFPLAYALFMVPFGQEIEPPLQQVTVGIVVALLHLSGVPASVDGVLIHAGPYWFEVAEACSGSKFVLAMVAYGALVANTCFTRPGRRAVFMAVALVVPVIANGVRAFATIYMAQVTGVEAAAGADHIVFGWVFFGVVMALVMALGWRWFDRAPDDAVFDPAALSPPSRRRIDPGIAAALILTTAAIFPLWASADAQAADPPKHARLPDVAGWKRVPVDQYARWIPHYPAADQQLKARYSLGDGTTVDVASAVYDRQHEGKELVGFGIGVLREGDRWIRVADLPDIAGGSVMRIATAAPDGGTVERLVATWYRVGGMVTGDARIVKLATLKARMTGGPPQAVALHVSAVVRPDTDARAAIARFASTLGPIDRAADGIADGH